MGGQSNVVDLAKSFEGRPAQYVFMLSDAYGQIQYPTVTTYGVGLNVMTAHKQANDSVINALSFQEGREATISLTLVGVFPADEVYARIAQERGVEQPAGAPQNASDGDSGSKTTLIPIEPEKPAHATTRARGEYRNLARLIKDRFAETAIERKTLDRIIERI